MRKKILKSIVSLLFVLLIGINMRVILQAETISENGFLSENGEENESEKMKLESDDGIVASGRDTGIEWSLDSEGLLLLTVSGEHKGHLENVEGLSSHVGEVEDIKVTGTGYGSCNSWFMNFRNVENIDLSGFNTENVTDMSGMFFHCDALKNINFGDFDTTNVESFALMFIWCGSIRNLDLSSFDTSNATNMRMMFCGCESLETLSIDNFDTSKVTDMERMFSGCKSLESLSISNFDTSKVTNMNNMFSFCESLETLSIGNFDTSNVTDMAYMFENCSNLRKLDLSNFNTTKVTTMSSMFSNCSNLQELKLDNFDTSLVTGMGSMFYECNSLKELNLSGFHTDNVKSIEYMFWNCNNLHSLDLRSFNLSNADMKTGGSLYHGDSSALVELYLPANVKCNLGFIMSMYDADGLTCGQAEKNLDVPMLYKRYAIFYVMDGGDNNPKNPLTYCVGSERVILRNPTKTGYQFKGWYTDPSLTNRISVIEIGSTGDKTLYAKWKKIVSENPKPDPGQPEQPVDPDPGSQPTPSTPSTPPTPSTPSTPDDATEKNGQIKSFVTRMYTVVLKRNPDEGGLNNWTNGLKSGKMDGASLAGGFICSNEFVGKNLSNEEFVKILYEAFFNRQPDLEGKAAWMSVLERGEPRTKVLAGFVNSAEFGNLCGTYGIARGTMEEDGSNVYNEGVRNFVLRNYTKALGRNGETNGVENWCYQINKGKMSALDVAMSFFHSREFLNKNMNNNDYVECLYETFLGRASDAQGRAYWVGQLNSGKSRDEVMEGFAYSREFKNIMAEYGL